MDLLSGREILHVGEKMNLRICIALLPLHLLSTKLLFPGTYSSINNFRSNAMMLFGPPKAVVFEWICNNFMMVPR